MGRKQALRAKELIQIAGEFPEHEYWIRTGKEMTESGHKPNDKSDAERPRNTTEGLILASRVDIRWRGE